MNDLPPLSATSDDLRDDSEIRQRLRVAEAAVETLQNALRGQEGMADRLSDAMNTTALAEAELARAQIDLANAIRSSGWRGVARAWKRRVLRLLHAQRNEVRHVAPVAESANASSGGSGVWTDIRYAKWIELYDTLDDERRSSLLTQLREVDNLPLVSIVFPVYNPPEDYLRQAIDSVRAQLYTNWELCIADDRSTLPHVAKVLEEYSARDGRILVQRRETNGHISACSNSAMALARGTWFCLMDHDDVMAEHALAVAVLAIVRTPGAAVLYSDEDHIESDGRRTEPYFKPDFDPLLLLGQNYFSHLCMIRSDLVALVGGFREGYEGSQDWDLILRVIEHVRPDQVVHVPHVLYHWRVHSESTASSVAAKPYVVEVSRRVVQEHLDRLAVDAQVTTLWGTSFNRITWALSPAPPKVSVIILPRAATHLRRCVESIRVLTRYPQIEIILFDDGGFRPPMRQVLRDHANWLRIVRNTSDLSDSAQRNIAAKTAGGDVLCFVDDDVEVLGNSWLEEMVGVLLHPGIGCVGTKLLYPDFRIQHAGIVIGIGGNVGSPHRLAFDRLSYGYSGRLRLVQCPSAVSGVCMAVRREAFEDVGGFSEEHFTGMFGDVDLCLRLNEAGWRIGWTPHAEMLHYELPEDSRGADGANAVRFDRDIRYLHQRWGKWIEDDPSYNPNLSLAHETLSLAWPPRRSFG